MKKFGIYLSYLLSIHIFALVLFFIFRFLLYVSVDHTYSADVAGSFSRQAIAFVKGVWFDNVICCYILIIPLVIMCITACCNYTAKWIFRLSATIYSLLFGLSYIVAIANIPYFLYFFKNINSSIFNWFSYGGTTFGMIVEEPSFCIPLIGTIILVAAWVWFMIYWQRKFYKLSAQVTEKFEWKKCGFTAVVSIVLIGLCLFGIRGRMGYNPIKVSQAYYCQDPFLNQLGVSPMFNLLTSYMDDCRSENKQLTLMDTEKALQNAQRYLNRYGVEGHSPISRMVTDSLQPDKKNVVLVLMESMSAHLLKAFGNKENLTPFLDELWDSSLSFDNFYSAGIHTNHGMFATLYSYPAIMKRNAMKGSVIPTYYGLPNVLKDNGYSTLFFMTHESQYDNMNAFFRTNGFDEIYAQENYPKEKIANHFGVQDDFLYEYALPILDQKAAEGKPFFTVLLSISNHPPYVIPDYFKPVSQKPEQQIVEYADWSIRKLIESARQKPWYKNTIFVFLGDHGKLVGTSDCEMPQSYNHIPLMIYGESIKPEIKSCLGGQIDVAPTILGLLHMSYLQDNYGIDLLKEKRNAIFFTADDQIGVRDSSHFYIYVPKTEQEFCYKTKGRNLEHAWKDKRFGELQQYGFSMLQSAEMLEATHEQ